MCILQTILSRVQRMPGLTSSLVGLETVLGIDEDIDYPDYLDPPELREKGVPDVFEAMEQRFGDQHIKLNRQP